MMLWNTLANALVPPPAPRVPGDDGWLEQLGLSPAQRARLMPLVGRWRRHHANACETHDAQVMALLEPGQRWRMQRLNDVTQLPLSPTQRAQVTALRETHEARLAAQRHAFQLLADTMLTPWQRKLLARALGG